MSTVRLPRTYLALAPKPRGPGFDGGWVEVHLSPDLEEFVAKTLSEGEYGDRAFAIADGRVKYWTKRRELADADLEPGRLADELLRIASSLALLGMNDL